MISNEFHGGLYQLIVGEHAVVTGHDNVFHGACDGYFPAYATIDVRTGYLELTGNDIHAGDAPYCLRVQSYYDPGPVVLPLAGNYWGVSDPAEVAELIWDGEDDPSLPVTVSYEPIEPGSVPNESMGWGELKKWYR